MNTTFIDEAGNTGGDLWSVDQPYFVLAAITFPDNMKESLVEFITKEFLDNKVNTEKELKTITWVKNPRKRKSLERIVDWIATSHSCIDMVVVEKRFMEAGLIVETFFDGAYNDIEDYSWCSDKVLKKATANYYYDRLSDEDLNFIARTFIYDGDALQYQDCLNRVIAVTDNPRFLAMLEGAKSHIQEISETNNDLGVYDGLRKHILRSPNYTGFYALGNKLAEECATLGITSDILFDKASMCNKEFESIYNRFTNFKSDVVIPFWGELLTWKDRLLSFSVVDSKEETGVLAADIFATSMFNTLVKLKKGAELFRYDAYMLGLYMTLSQNYELLAVASDRFYDMAWSAISHYAGIIDQLKE